MRILVTGATGNVGREVVAHLDSGRHTVFAGSRSPGTHEDPSTTPVTIDFDDPAGHPGRYDAVFLMRPPQIADPEPFARFLDPMPRSTRIVFLSVQGADTAGYLPHAKIEARIAAMGFDHVFVRPSYFMDNLLTTLWPELAARRRIYLPSGGLTFDWVSARDIGAVCAAALKGGVPECAVTICSGRRLGFAAVCKAIDARTGTGVRYEPATLPGYVRHARSQDMAWGMIAVMLLLHFLPRFGRARRDDCSDLRRILGRPAETIEAYIDRNAERFARLADAGRR